MQSLEPRTLLSVTPTAITIAPTEASTFSGGVATFTANDVGPFGATIDWGDGSTAIGTVVSANGVDSVSGQHTYSDEGTYTISVEIADGTDSSTATATGTADVADADTLLPGTNTLATTEGTTFTGTVAEFTDATRLDSDPADFATTIDWGDGSTSAGTVSEANVTSLDMVSQPGDYIGQGQTYALTPANGVFTVQTDRESALTFSYEAGTGNNWSVSFDAPQGSELLPGVYQNVARAGVQSPNQPGLDVWGDSRGSNAVTGSFTVIDASYDTNGHVITFDATFVLYSDGAPTPLTGEIKYNAPALLVGGSHVYLQDGSYTLSTVINDDGAGTTSATASTTVNVAEADLTLAPSVTTLGVSEGATFSGAVATVSDPGTDPTTDFSAIINWGDGTSSVGTIAGAAGSYTVLGQHTYVDEGSFTATVLATEGSAVPVATASTTFLAQVADADAFVSDPGPFSATEGPTLIDGTVAAFTDTGYLANVPQDLSATIDWGDGTTSPGSVTETDVASLNMASQPGDFIGQGQTYSFSSATGTFAVPYNSASGLSFDYHDQNQSWSVEFIPPSGQRLVPGLYLDVTRPGAFSTQPGLDVAGDSRGSNTVTGSFDIITASYNATGQIVDFDATFIQHSDGAAPALTGEIKYQLGTFVVNGNHTYAQGGEQTITTTIADGAPGKATATTTTTVNLEESALTVSPTASTLNATEGSAVSGMLATFTDPGSDDPSSDYSAVINWGDGSTSAGTVTGTPGTYSVSGSHTYAEEGSYSISVVATEDNTLPLSTGTAMLTAVVADASLTIGSLAPPVAQEGQSFFNNVVLQFSDANPRAATSDFSATVHTGDATLTSFADPKKVAIVTDPYGGFWVLLSYTYAEELSDTTFSVSVSDAGGQTVESATTSFSVADAPLTGATASSGIGAVEGAMPATLSGVTFTDANAAAPLTDFSVTAVDWGDGSTNETGLTIVGTGGTYKVTGSHLYTEEGVYPFRITVTDAGGSVTTINGSANVADALLTGATTASAAGGVEVVTPAALSGATFGDDNTQAPSTDFSIASIVWGDGSTSTVGLKISGGDGNFTVSGSHLYPEDGTYHFVITVDDVGGSTTSITGTATVADAPLNGARAASASGGIEGVAAATLVGATFTDTNTAAISSDFSIDSVNWGDGSTDSAGLAIVGGGGDFTVTGSHLYADEGLYNFTVTILDAGGTKATISGSANIADATLSGGAGAAATDAVRGAAAKLMGATFTDANIRAAASDFSVSAVNWGDGSSDTTGLIISGSAGTYTLSGSHIYTNDGPKHFAITIHDEGGGNGITINGTAQVADAAMVGFTAASASGGVESVTAATLAGAAFTDADTGLPAGEFSITSIDWGDGNSDATGLSISGGAGNYTVGGSHLYAEEGVYSFTVSVRDSEGETALVSGMANVSDAPLNGTSATIATGVTVAGVVATLSDTDTHDVASDYAATIDWGDGHTAAGTVAAGNVVGQFNVTGNHAYSDGSSHTVTVTIDHGSQPPLTIESYEPGSLPISIVDAVYTIGSGTVSVPAATGLLASDMGTGTLTVSAGTQSGAEGGTFVIRSDGSFTYTPPANFPGYDSVQFTVTDSAGKSAAATLTVLSQHASVVWKFYESVLDRTPDPSGLQYWTNYFDNGGQTGDMAVGFFQSTELLDKIINDYYEQYLLRPADTAGLSYWAGVWRNTGGPEQIKAGFADSPEFFNSSGGRPDSWIAALYQRILNRAPDPAGEQFWSNYYQQLLAAGRAPDSVRYEIALGFFTSTEAYKTDVANWFEEYLFRAPTSAELTQYVDQMTGGASDRTIEQEITNLPEYTNNPPLPPGGTISPLPDYYQTTTSTVQSQATVAKDIFYSGL